ncbi:hypothetical protein [Leucobacter tenebrionis]|uniref:hypothetical protein n=1 Tax=Leucobacter tenebrionis TaxID=2873270 RepID=UPI001CA71EA4|nr:hypothetical protein [Leucobacter tenebrionis]QZY52484.1 hypothetical protein KVY00_03185 [Leucobacter tenebrionis]
MSHVSARHGVSRWSRFLGAGAAATVVVLLGSAALAPYSISMAFAADGSGAFGQRQQRLDAADASVAVLDTSVEAADTSAAGSGKSAGAGGARSAALYTLEQFMFTGAVNWGGYKFTFYSEQVLPGPGLAIPGRHVNDDGYVSDADGYIVLAGSHPKGTVFDTPFGYQGKIYDRGTFGNHLDVYIR